MTPLLPSPSSALIRVPSADSRPSRSLWTFARYWSESSSLSMAKSALKPSDSNLPAFLSMMALSSLSFSTQSKRTFTDLPMIWSVDL